MSLENTLKIFAEPQIAEIRLPVADGFVSLNSRVKLVSSTGLEAFFPPKKLPMEALDPEGICGISCKTPAGGFALEALIERVLDERRLLLMITMLSPPVQRRAHFRIDTEIALGYRIPRKGGGGMEIAHQKMNLSGGGICFEARHLIGPGEKLFLEMVLPGPEPVWIECGARVLRKQEVDGGKVEVACEFSGISRGDQDAITAFCLREQRMALKGKGAKV